MNADGSGQTKLTSNFSADYMSVWSPDDQRIAFVSERDGSPQIYVMNGDGSNPTRLTQGGAVDVLPTWSPDGRRIAFQTNREGNNEIYEMNADGSGSGWWDSSHRHSSRISRCCPRGSSERRSSYRRATTLGAHQRRPLESDGSDSSRRHS